MIQRAISFVKYGDRAGQKFCILRNTSARFLPDSNGIGGEFMSLKVFSDAFENGRIKDQYGKMSSDVIEGVPQLSFPIKWEDAPEGTKSFAVVFIDYDNAIGEGIIWVHWLAANIPASATGLEEDAARTDASLLQGKTTFMLSNGLDNPVSNRYGGPAPEDRPHEYELQVFALSDMLDLKPGYYYNEFLGRFWTLLSSAACTVTKISSKVRRICQRQIRQSV